MTSSTNVETQQEAYVKQVSSLRYPNKGGKGLPGRTNYISALTKKQNHYQIFETHFHTQYTIT